MSDAELLTWANDNGYIFGWEDDWEIGNHFEEYGDVYSDGEPDTCEICVMYDQNGDIVAAMGCINGASEEYRREVEADLIYDVHEKWLKIEKRKRSKMRGRKRTLKRSLVV